MRNKIITWAGIILVAFIFTGSGLMKLLGGEQTEEIAKNVGGHSHVIILGVLELLIVVLWLIPRTGVIATLLAVAYMGGAMAAHFVSNQSILVPTVIQIFIWIVAAYRFKELIQRAFGQVA